MKWPRRRRRDITRQALLDGLRQLAGQIKVEHRHTVKQERIPAPPGGELVVVRPDGSDAWRGRVQVGRQAYSVVQVPAAVLFPDLPASTLPIRIEFRWDTWDV